MCECPECDWKDPHPSGKGLAPGGEQGSARAPGLGQEIKEGFCLLWNILIFSQRIDLSVYYLIKN